MMSNHSSGPEEFNDSSVNAQSFLLMLVAIAIGLILALLVLPIWTPNMTFSLGSDAPKAYWYLSRATAFVSITLLWISMALGLGITNKMARLWPGAPAAFAIHEYVSLLGLAFAGFHALIILGDHFIHFTLAQILIPFATTDYHPFWVGLGQIGFYVWALLAATFYVRPLIGQKSWRFLHYGSFGMYLLAIFHGLFSGTDTSTSWAQNYYWYSIGSLLFLLMYRILSTLINKYFPEKRPAPTAVPRSAQQG
jgi:predicted ferric reductase